MAAYDRLTGEPRWTSLDDVQAYTSPMLVTLAGREQILTVTASRAVGLDPADGTLLWEFPWVVPTVPNIAQPLLLGDDRLFLSAGYGHGAAVIEVRHANGSLHAEEVWRNTRMKNKFSSSVLHDGYVYGLSDGILECQELKTGKRVWREGRYGHGQILRAGDLLLVLSEQGELSLVEATPETPDNVLGTIQALEGRTWNNLALAGDLLLVRNAREAVCYRLAVE